MVDPFAITARPVYAFPTPFPPLIDEVPIPGSHRTGSFQIPWDRICAIEPIRRPQADIDELAKQMDRLVLSDDASSDVMSPLPSFAFVPPRAPLPALIRAASASSRAQPLTTLVSAAGSPPSLLSKSFSTSKLSRVHPTPFPLKNPEDCFTTRSPPIPILHPHTSAGSRRTRKRGSPTTPYGPRSWSVASTVSSRSASSSWSDDASSAGPLTPPASTSPCMDLALPIQKDISPARISPDVHRSSDIDGVHVSTFYR